MVFANGSFLFCAFFVSRIILFIAGKDNFGRTEIKFAIKSNEKIKKEGELQPSVGVKKEDNFIFFYKEIFKENMYK